MIMDITAPRYIDETRSNVKAVVDGVELQIPVSAENRHYLAILASGVQIADPVPPVLDAHDYAAAIQAHIDATAKSKGYADGVACASYITSTIPGWQAEAAAFVPWRDSVWLAAYLILGQVQAGQRAAPTIEDLIAELPVITWPGA